MQQCFLPAVLAGAVLSLLPGAGLAGEPAARPNIIVILSDDMGYSDIGCYGGEISTPNLDELAENGLRYSQFYNTARCCPTRASLLTGLYPHQAGVGHMTGDRGLPGYTGELGRNCLTIAEALKPAGYATYLAGKWHVTSSLNPKGKIDNWPRQRGFDRFYGTIHGAGSFFDPTTLTRDNTFISPYADPDYRPEGPYYYTDAISDHACRFIEEHDSSKPFFLYVAYTAAHWPMHALPKDIAKYEGRYDEGYRPIREARLKRLREKGLINPDWNLPPLVGDWNRVTNKKWEARGMEVYAAMIDNMDQGIGRIMRSLQDKGAYENTLVFYLQDNGGCAEGMGRKGHVARADKPTLPPMKPTDLQPDMIPKKSRDGFPVIQGIGVMPGPADTFHAYGRSWANVSNTPFQKYKHWVHEGGISTPLIAHWPAGIPRTGEVEHQPGHLIDIMATCLSVAGATYPGKYRDVELLPLEGKSLAATFTGGAIDRDALYFEHEANCAIRKGKWKLVAKGFQGPRFPWELYDMESDRTETQDLAAENPELVAELSGQWEDWAVRSLVKPGPWEKSQKR